jgi:YVTN family beta-propeller protein
MATGYLYVPNTEGTVSVIDSSTDQVVTTILVGTIGGTGTTDGVAVSPDGRFAYAASENGILAVIDTATNSVTAKLSVGAGADFVAFSPDGSRAYVSGGNSVAVVDTTSNTVVANITVPTAYAVAVNPDGSDAYVTSEGGGTVSVIDTSTNTVTGTINVGALPTDVAVSPDGTHVYASNYSSGTVSVIDTATNTATATISVGGNPYGVVVSPDGSHAYVATWSGNVEIIDTATNSVTGSIAVGPAVGVAISADGSRLYVSHYTASNTVTVIDTTTDTIVDTINVGNVPEYLAVAPAPPAPQLALAVDSGIPGDDVTNVGTVVLSGLQSGATWQYSMDGGSHWINGSGTNFTLTGDGAKSVLVHQTNAANVTSSDTSLSFLLDTHAPVVTETLNKDTGLSSTDHITNDSTLTGSGDPNAVVHFSVDGVATTATVSADSSGHWTFVPTGLSDGAHTIIAAETDLAGNVGTASLAFTLDTTAPVPTITNETLTNGKVTLAGTTAEANDIISVYDGSSLLGTVKTDSNGNWNFITGRVSNQVHTYTVDATDPAGNVGHSPNEAILGSTNANTLVGGSGNDTIIGNGGNDTFKGAGGADMLFGGSGHDTFVFNAITDSTPASHDTIVNFNHTTDQIEFANIAGITGSNGTPTFEGKLAGSGNLTLNAHSVGYIEVGGNTEVLVNTTAGAESVSLSDTHAANMEIVLNGTHLGLTSHDFYLL